MKSQPTSVDESAQAVSPAKVPRVSAGDRLSQAPARKQIDYALLARRVIRDGQPFCRAALEAGYAESVALKGLRFAMADCHAPSEAVRREIAVVEADVTRLNPLAITRLLREIADMQSPNAMKAIELAGRFKETDWFVRAADASVGVFLALSEAPPPQALEPIDAYKD